MSNTIPPLLCSTPPPIDFDDGGGTANGNDDFEAFESGEDVYGQFEGPSKPTTPKHSIATEEKDLDLPIPDFIPFPINPTGVTSKIDVTEPATINSHAPKATDEYYQKADTHLEQANAESIHQDVGTEKNDKSNLTKDSIGFLMSEPPPVDIGYSSESQSPKNSRDDSPLSLEFSPENLSDDEDSIDFQINESRYDDNTSLPSLKFDAINISKSVTPILEDKAIVNKITSGEASSSSSSENEVSNTGAFQINVSAEPTAESSQDNQGDSMQHADNENVYVDEEPTWVSSNYSDRKTPNDLQDSQATLVEYEETEDAILDNELSTTQKRRAISEPHTEPEHFDDFNADFQSFESCPVFSEASSSATNEMKSELSSEAFTFEADFSQVDFPPIESCPIKTYSEVVKATPASDKTEDLADNFDDDFEDFQDFKVAEVGVTSSISSNHESSKVISEVENVTNESIDDDDDFGEFSDFKEADVISAAASSENYSVLQLPKLDDKLKGVLEMMFPVEDNSLRISTNDKSTSPSVLASNLTLDLREIDSAKALEYQWLQSNMKNALVKCLGIDSRNILYGEKWNSSMPRFAANLGFGPLEPLKPTKISSDASTALQPMPLTSSSSLDKPSTSGSSSEVPAVKFDWNSSGLVNPLDGVKEIIHEGKAETIHATQFDDTYESSHIASLTKNQTATQQTTVDIVAPVSNINNDLKCFEKVVDDVTIETSNTTHTSYRTDENYTKSPTMPPTSKFIPLKETHIFTPSKSEGTIARSVSKSIEKQPIDFDYEIAAAGIVINEQVVNKEYRDIVYNPETENNNCLDTFTTSLSDKERNVKKDPNEPIVDPNKSFRHKSTGSDFLSRSIMNIMEKKEVPVEPECPVDDEFSDFQQRSPPPVVFHEPSLKNSDSVASSNREINAVNNVPMYNNSTNLTSRHGNLDEEFTDFQSVPPSVVSNSHSKSTFDAQRKNKAETSSLNDEMILSPAILLPQAVKLERSEPKINWPSDSNIDPEELARLEQLFPQAKQVAAQSFIPSSNQNTPNVSLSPKKDRKDDEDWSDFVSVPPPVNSTTQKPKDVPMAQPTKLSTISKTYDDEDWSDFVSSAPAAGPAATKPWSMPQLPPPQFSSWNQPTAYPSLQPSMGRLPIAPATSHYSLQQHEVSKQRVPIVPGKGVHQIKLQSNNNQFSMNGQMNTQSQSDVNALHRLHYQQQQQLYSNQQRLPQPPRQQPQMHQRANPNTNSNFNVLKSQLNSAPSISLIPDLSFTAPKSLVQLSRTNTSNKK